MCLSPRQGQNQAAELVEAHQVIGALRVIADLTFNFRIRGLNTEVVKRQVELLHFIEFKNPVAVHVE